VPINCDVEKIPIAKPLFEELAVRDKSEGNKASIVLNATKNKVKVNKKTLKFKFKQKKINWLAMSNRILINKMYFVFLNFSEITIKGTIPKNDKRTAGR